ncbi:G2/mitotic-specific cyclin [Ascosphaera acerosa]|nr:G2/mitotic-specific cyclin [Ascosphaera acerosa]
MPPTRALRSRTITNENDENMVTTRMTRAKASALTADHTNTLVKKPLQSKKAAAAAAGVGAGAGAGAGATATHAGTGVNGTAAATVMTRRRAALGDVSNMNKKTGSSSSSSNNGAVDSITGKPLVSHHLRTHDENTAAAEAKEAKKPTTRAALASKTSAQSGGVQKLTRGTTTRSVLGAKDSNKQQQQQHHAAEQPAAAARKGSGSGSMGDKKAGHHRAAGGRSARKTTSTEPATAAARKKAEKIEQAISAGAAVVAQPHAEVKTTAPAPAPKQEESEREEKSVQDVGKQAVEHVAEPAPSAEQKAAAIAEADKENALSGPSPADDVDEVVDLDTEDLLDPLMAAEYVVEIFEHLRELEIQTLPNPTYMDHQEEIDWKMRGILVDWLIEVHARFRLLPETLFLAVNIVDRFLSAEVVALSRLQLVGATAMFIASKYEEVLSPHVANFSQLADEAFSDKEILDAERHVLATLNYDISYPNPMNFLRRISKADNYDVHTRTIGKYLLEISLVDHRFMGYKQSHVAAAAMYMARLMWNSGPWDATLAHYAGYTREEIWPVFRLMIDYLRRPPAHEAFFKKYASKKFMKASITVRKWAKTYYPIFLGEGGYENFMADIKTDEASLQ